MNLNDLLKTAVERGASDLHLSVGLAPVLRVDGILCPLDHPALEEQEMKELALELLGKEKLPLLESHGEVDLSNQCPGVGTFRVNLYRQRGLIGAAFRVINSEILSIPELGLPGVVATLARRPSGLVLVTGPTGCGKSTTLAAMTDLINCERECHVVTLEDPIEYVHRHKKSIITQREIGADSRTFPTALRAALRQDPDVILVGEMRDLETIAIALTAAETGHLVMATLHTSTAPQTVERVIDVFPPRQQAQVRVQLANSLAGVISQRLLRRKEGWGRIPAVEVLVATPAVRSLIREGKVHQLYSYMQAGGRLGMQTMDRHLQQLFSLGKISSEEALEYCYDRDDMLGYFKSCGYTPATAPRRMGQG